MRFEMDGGQGWRVTSLEARRVFVVKPPANLGHRVQCFLKERIPLTLRHGRAEHPSNLFVRHSHSHSSHREAPTSFRSAELQAGQSDQANSQEHPEEIESSVLAHTRSLTLQCGK
ncbi:MAG: hypothetical protein AMXMBFR33_28080 [Candidatus Xenobia bacterium]